MIAYKQSDVRYSWDQDIKDYNEKYWPRTCGYVKEEVDEEFKVDGGEHEEEEDEEEEEEESNKSYYTKDHKESHSRKKRQADQYEYTPTKTRCPLLLVADYRFYHEMGASNTKTTINYLVIIEFSFLYYILKANHSEP